MADPIELETTFDDASLEMNASGDKFRVGNVAGKHGQLADPQTPAAHAASHVSGSDAIPSATSGSAGLMSSGAFSKLAGIAPGAAALTLAAPANVAPGGTAQSGAATDGARADHVHSLAVAAPTSTLAPGGANSGGAASSVARSDHSHAMVAYGSAANTICQGNDARLSDPRAPTVHGSTHGANAADAVPTAAPTSTLAPGAANSLGSANGLARSDHSHAMVGYGTTTGTICQGDDSRLSNARTPTTHGSTHVSSDPIPNATGSAAGLMAAADFSKLAGIAAGADVTLTALGAASAAVSVNGQKLTNVGTPTAANDGATKAYVDAAAQGLDVKKACRLLASTNHGLTGLAAIDGLTPVAGDRVLLIGQTTQSQNGIYVAASGAWARATDADQNNEVNSGMYTFVTAGTVYANTGWILTTADPINVGVTALVFAQFSGAGAVVAGDGLTRSGQTLNVTANADGSIIVAPDDIKVGVINDTQHGNRGGGSLHAIAVSGGAAGFVTGTDKFKLDSVALNAAALSVSTAPTQVQAQQAAAIGSSTQAAKADHAHSVLTAAPTALVPGNANAAGVAASLALSDHVHGLPAYGSAAGTICEGNDARLSNARTPTAHGSTHGANAADAVPTAAPVSLAAGGSNSPGSANTLARSDHVHQLPSYGSASGTICEGSDARLGDDRTASGLRTASNVVAVTGAPAPTTGQVLTAGSSTQAVWLTQLFALTNGFRLAFAAGVPVPDLTAQSPSTLYLVPYRGDRIALYYGTQSRWVICRAASQVSLALSGMTAGELYDIYAYTADGANITLERSAAWQTATSARGASLALAYFDGVLCLGSNQSRRYLGTIRALSATQVSWSPIGGSDDTFSQVGLWNLENRVQLPMQWLLATNWTVTAANQWLKWRGNASSAGIEFVQGYAPDAPVSLDVRASVYLPSGTANYVVSPSTDAVGSFAAIHPHVYAPAAGAQNISGHSLQQPAAGRRAYNANIFADNTALVIQGTSNVSGTSYSGMTALVWC